MTEHRIQLFVEEYLLAAQVTEFPDRVQYMTNWGTRLHTECVQAEIVEVFRRIVQKMKVAATDRYH